MESTVAILTVAIRRESDLLLARKRARHICQGLGLSVGDTTRVVTALSEIARNAFEYCNGGTVAFSIESHSGDHQELVVRVTDQGAGIADVPGVMSEQF